MTATTSQAWPVLREELALYGGGVQPDGQPTWTLHDPVRHLFFQLDWLSFEILSHWALADAQAIAHAIESRTTLRVSTADVDGVLAFVKTHQLVQVPLGQAAMMARSLQQRRGGVGQWLLHHYLFFRVPLWQPDAWLGRWVERLQWLYRPGFAWLTVLVALLGLTGILREWERFQSTLIDHFTWQGMLSYGLTLCVVKVWHELAHGLTAKRMGCRVPTMGVAFLVLWPVAYTDTSEVWKLPQPHQRLAVAGAGIVAELTVAAWASWAWVWLPPGQPQALAFLLATTGWVSTVLVNASPFMRFDGYFLLCDALNMPNLHERSFALARWHLREVLFALGEPAPEAMSASRRRGLVLFAWATWLYRLVLFLGIAAMVYHFFIKAVGIFLFAVELVWFVMRPIVQELKQWHARRAHIWRHGRVGYGVLVLLLWIGVCTVPLPLKVHTMGLLTAQQQVVIYAPAGAQVTALPYRHGSRVPQGEAVLVLQSPELQYRAAQSSARQERLSQSLLGSAFDQEQRKDFHLAAEQLATVTAEAETVSADAARYAPTAPFDGVLYDLDPDLKVGDWVEAQSVLGRLVKPGARQVVTYVEEDELSRLHLGQSAHFLVDAQWGPALALQIVAIDRDASRVLPERALASQYGGHLLVREQQHRLYPEKAVYRVTFKVVSGQDVPAQSWRGQVAIEAAAQSLAWVWLQQGLRVVWREAGF